MIRILKVLLIVSMLCPGLLLINWLRSAVEAEPPNIILISIDTLRKDHLGCYGYSRETSPNIDALAAGATVFYNDFSSSPWTLPSHTSMLTGLYPSFHGLQDDGVKLAQSITTLPELLSRHGYYTLAVTSHVYVSSEFELEKGFILFDDSLIEKGKQNPVATTVADRIIQQMEKRPNGAYFLFAHFFDPHLNYEPPPLYYKKFADPSYHGTITGTIDSIQAYMRSETPMPGPDLAQLTALYDGEIAYTDHEIGRMLDLFRARGWLDNTVIILTSDHGEEFKDHGRLGHPNSFFQEIINVPLIIAGCNRMTPGRRYDTISPVDILPTVLDIAGLQIPGDIQGISLVSGVRDPDQPVFAETIRSGNEMRMVKISEYKLIHGFQGNKIFFTDLKRDPLEQTPMMQDPTGGSLTAALEQYTINADSGWHIKFISLGDQSFRCRGTIHASGVLIKPRKYFSRLMTNPTQYRVTDHPGVVLDKPRKYFATHVIKPNKTQFTRFETGSDGKTLEFDLSMTTLMSEIVFDVNPLESRVTFNIEVISDEDDAGLFLGAGTRMSQGEFTLVRSDPRLQGLPFNYMETPTGCYIRTVIDPGESSVKTNLTDDAINRLRALGYITNRR